MLDPCYCNSVLKSILDPYSDALLKFISVIFKLSLVKFNGKNSKDTKPKHLLMILR